MTNKFELQLDDLPENSIRMSMRDAISKVLERYFEHLSGEPPHNLHRLFTEESEAPLVEATLKYTNNNKVHAAKILGLARGTLRKKIHHLGLGTDEAATPETNNVTVLNDFRQEMAKEDFSEEA